MHNLNKAERPITVLKLKCILVAQVDVVAILCVHPSNTCRLYLNTGLLYACIFFLYRVCIDSFWSLYKQILRMLGISPGFLVPGDLVSASYKLLGIWTARINGPCTGIHGMASPTSDLFHTSCICTT